MARTGRFVVVTGEELLALLKGSGVLAREYAIYSPYTITVNDSNNIVISGQPIPSTVELEDGR